MIRANGGWDAFTMVLIKACENKQQSLMEEDRIMREMKSNMNNNRAYCNEEDHKETKQKWHNKYRESNKDILNAKSNEYYKENKDKRSAFRKI
jgi:hypothetical protein